MSTTLLITGALVFAVAMLMPGLRIAKTTSVAPVF